MFKRASRESAPPSSRNQLPDSALQPLAGLRSAIESRLAALEDALANPGRGESLSGLILDLTRVATEEAQAAAAQACLATKAEADRQSTDFRASVQATLDSAQSALTSSQAALERERTAGAELRRAADQARQEIEKQAELLAAREQLEAGLRSMREQLETELARERSTVAELQRAAEDAGQQLKSERASSAELRRSAERAEARIASIEADQAKVEASHQARIASIERERAKAEASHETAMAELSRAHDAETGDLVRTRDAALAEVARELQAAAVREHAYADLMAQLEAERAELSDLRRAAEHSESVSASIGFDAADGDAEREELESELARQRDIVARLQRSLHEAEESLEAERASKASLSASVESADQRLAAARAAEAQAIADAQYQLAAARAETDNLRIELEAAKKRIEAAPAATAESASAPVASSKASAKASAPEPAPAKPQEEWQAVRLADRYVFRKAITVQINGDPGVLFDISISGCQVLSNNALKPNHAVKVLLSGERTPIACAGKVVWTRLEATPAGRTLGYRAGVRFTKADEAAIEAFATRHVSP